MATHRSRRPEGARRSAAPTASPAAALDEFLATSAAQHRRAARALAAAGVPPIPPMPTSLPSTSIPAPPAGRGQLERRQAGAGLPVLRHRRRRWSSPPTAASSRSTISSRRCARSPTSKTGWEADRVSVQCQSCQAISLFEPSRVAQNCEFCGSPTIIAARARSRTPIVPESVLPFVVSRDAGARAIRAWYGSRWFAPNRLKAAALTDKVHGLYMPYWTFDAQVAARWTAEAGHYYYVTERRGEQDRAGAQGALGAGRRRARAFLRRRAGAGDAGRPRPTAAQGRAVPDADLVPYDAGYVSGWVVEQYQIDLSPPRRARARAWTRTVRAAVRAAGAGRHAAQPAGRRRLLAARPSSTCSCRSGCVAYTYGSRTFQVLVNGQTGRIAGKQPYSWVKIALAILAALIVLMIIAYIQD